MKIKITLKDPDGVYEALNDAADKSLIEVSGITSEERKSLYGLRRESISSDCKQWIKYGEYVTIEIDTDAKTAKVLEA